MLGFSALSEAPISATAEAQAPLVVVPVGAIGASPIGVYAIGQASVTTGGEAGVNGSANADLPEITTASPEASVSASSTISIAAPEITVTAPEPTASGSAISEVQADTIALTPAESVATGAAEATFNDLIDVGITAPEETLSVGSLVSVQSNTITITAPEPNATGVISVTASADSNTVTVTAPEAQSSVDATASAPISETLVFPKRGQGFKEGFFAGIIDTTQDNIIDEDYYQSGQRYGLIVSPRSYESSRVGGIAWDSSGGQPEAECQTRWNGLESTNHILSKSQFSQYEIFDFVRSLRTTHPLP